jgi:hypothetical protein
MVRLLNKRELHFFLWTEEVLQSKRGKTNEVTHQTMLLPMQLTLAAKMRGEKNIRGTNLHTYAQICMHYAAPIFKQCQLIPPKFLIKK